MAEKRFSWSAVPLRWKVVGWFAAIMTVMVLILGAMFLMGRATFRNFEKVQRSHMGYYVAQEALESEYRAIEACIRENSAENLRQYEDACGVTWKAIEALPFDYNELGGDRYDRTLRLIRGYGDYRVIRDAFMAADPADPAYGQMMDEVTRLQKQLSDYALLLVQATIEQNSAIYQRQAAFYTALPWICVGLVLLAILILGIITQKFSEIVVDPLLVLAQASRKIADNDFSGEDLPVLSQDELGDLTLAFNRMKQATAGQIATLEEKNRMAQQLHKEELAKVGLQRNLDQTRLEMLRSQVDPHFLFNTLNMISCMARLEDASTTDQMILRLSSLFRYNLRTKAQVVWLEEELEVLEDYLYLQQMRFDGRMTCRTILRVDPARVRIPSFTLQPVVENAFHHGLRYMEDGGRITLRIWQEEENVIVSIADNGLGMTPEELDDLRQNIGSSEQTGRGIGLGNICRRIQMLYPGSGGFHIYSCAGKGTVVQLVIPQRPGDGV